MDTRTEKQRTLEAKVEIKKQLQARKESKDTISTYARATTEQNILRQVMQLEVPVKVKDLLETMPYLRTGLLNTPIATISTVE